MRVCIPTIGENGLDDSVGEHFGRVPTYTIVDLETDKVKVIPNTSHHMGGQGYPPELLIKEGVTVMVCRGLGRRAINMFEEFGINVYIGASGTVRDALMAFKRGRLQKAGAGDGCESHAFHDRHHHI
jgi:predicted Fe-Mo cluster-binding NifX family protein